MEFSITPMDQGQSVGEFVARCVEIVDRSGLDYRLHSMGTVVEGELDPLLDLLKQSFEALQSDSHRISCSVKFDYRVSFYPWLFLSNVYTPPQGDLFFESFISFWVVAHNGLDLILQKLVQFARVIHLTLSAEIVVTEFHIFHF